VKSRSKSAPGRPCAIDVEHRKTIHIAFLVTHLANCILYTVLVRTGLPAQKLSMEINSLVVTTFREATTNISVAFLLFNDIEISHESSVVMTWIARMRPDVEGDLVVLA
jgi:hypothetical protein